MTDNQLMYAGLCVAYLLVATVVLVAGLLVPALVCGGLSLYYGLGVLRLVPTSRGS